MSRNRSSALASRRGRTTALWPLVLAPLLLGAATLERTGPDQTTPRFPKGLSAPELGPAPSGLEDWSQARCASCHADEAKPGP